MSKILITGGSGYIGSQIATYMLKSSYDVHVLVRANSNLVLLKNIKLAINIHVVDGSLQNLISIIRNIKPSVVIHTAAYSLINHNEGDIEDLIKSNILFPVNLLEAMVKNKIYNFINTASFWQNYKNEKYSPVNLYAGTKEAFETISRYYFEATPLKMITLKLFDTYGIDDPRGKIFNQLENAIKNNKSIKMSQGNQLINLVYISDIVQAYSIALGRLLNDQMVKKNENFLICSDKSVSLKEIVNEYLEISKNKIKIEWGGIKYRPRQIMKPWTKGKKLPGWEPKISLKKGLKTLINKDRLEAK